MNLFIFFGFLLTVSLFNVVSIHPSMVLYESVFGSSFKELEQIRKWLIEEGLSPESSREAQLGFLWRSFLHARSRLDGVTKELETNRLQHFAEMAEVDYHCSVNLHCQGL